MMQQKLVLINITKVLIAVGLLIWLVASGRLDCTILLSAPLSIVHLFGFLLLFANMLLQAIRWWYLLKIQNIDLSLAQAMQLSWIGQFFSLMLPGASGGELIRSYYITRDVSTAKLAGVSTVLLDRAIGLYALLWLGIPSLLFLSLLYQDLPSAIVRMGALTLLLVVATSVLFGALWVRPTRNLILALVPRRFQMPLKTTLNAYYADGRNLCTCFALSLIAGIMLMGAFLLAGQIIGSHLAWQQVFLVGPLVTVANSLPITPGGVGVAETTASTLFAQFGIETGATIMLIVRLWVVILRLPGGLIYVLRTHRLNVYKPSIEKPNHQQDREFR